MSVNFNYRIPTRLIFGPGKLEELGSMELPGRKALIVLSAGTSMKRHGYLERVISLLEKNGVDSVVFDKILPNPIKDHVMEGAELARREGCDFVVGLGGGSSIDSAKSIALMAKNPGDYWDYIVDGTGKGQPVKGGVLPIVAITTTAGTGTEADPWTVITNLETTEKIGFGNDETFPLVSFIDPELMLSVPPKLTAYQGFDAFFHAAEGVMSKIATPLSDAYALKSIELLTNWLPAAVKDGSNLEARTNVALANTISGLVESTSSCTSEHSMEHALSAYHTDLPHGAGLIMLSLPYFTKFAQICPERMSLIAKAMGEEASAEGCLKGLAKLQKACGVAELKMSDYGIVREELPELARKAHESMSHLYTQDRKYLTVEDTLNIMEEAYR
ncbi:MAG: iron-containing alcohol dehydrogenase [Spirochaetales bacterium]|nr:iron-containing alcohol dehydrogenase [Spirochaetales bacterium]